MERYPGIYIDVSYYKKWIAAGDSSAIVGNFVTIVVAAVIAAINCFIF